MQLLLPKVPIMGYQFINTSNSRAGGHTSTVQEEEEYQGYHFWPNSNLATVGVIALVNQHKFYGS